MEVLQTSPLATWVRRPSENRRAPLWRALEPLTLARRRARSELPWHSAGGGFQRLDLWSPVGALAAGGRRGLGMLADHVEQCLAFLGADPLERAIERRDHLRRLLDAFSVAAEGGHDLVEIGRRRKIADREIAEPARVAVRMHVQAGLHHGAPALVVVNHEQHRDVM